MSSGHWLRFLSSDSGTDTLLVCEPPGGRGPSGFQAWRAVVPGTTQLAVVAPPGREARFPESAVTDVAAHTSAVCEQIESVVDGRRLVLVGSCIGGMLAYETARLLLERGVAVERLGVVAAWPANRYRRQTGPRSIEEGLDLLHRWNGTSDEVLADPDFARVLLPAFMADLALGDGYDGVNAPPLPVPILAVAGADDEDAGAGVMADWAKCTSREFLLHTLPGGHFIHHDQARTTAELLLARQAHHIGRPVG